jgi:hypothetical protein
MPAKKLQTDPMLLLLQNIESSQALIAGKIDRLIDSNFTLSTKIDKTNVRIDPIEKQYQLDCQPLTLGQNIKSYLKNPLVWIGLMVSGLLFTMNWTSAMNEGKHYTIITHKIDSYITNNNPIDIFSNSLKKTQNFIYGLPD